MAIYENIGVHEYATFKPSFMHKLDFFARQEEIGHRFSMAEAFMQTHTYTKCD